MKLDRRTALSGALAATGAVTLAACASEPEILETTPPRAGVTNAPEPVSGEQLLGKADEIMVGSGKKFPLSDTLTILVTRPRPEVFRAFDATCTHAGCIVSGVSDDQISCGCHGARYNTDSGEPEAGPAKAPLAKITVELRGDDLYAVI